MLSEKRHWLEYRRHWARRFTRQRRREPRWRGLEKSCTSRSRKRQPGRKRKMISVCTFLIRKSSPAPPAECWIFFLVLSLSLILTKIVAERRIRERLEQQAVYAQQMALKAQRVAAEREEEEQFKQMVITTALSLITEPTQSQLIMNVFGCLDACQVRRRRQN